MQFSINKSALQKELGFVQGIVERKNTIPALSNILIESVGGSTIRFTRPVPVGCAGPAAPGVRQVARAAKGS